MVKEKNFGKFSEFLLFKDFQFFIFSEKLSILSQEVQEKIKPGVTLTHSHDFLYQFPSPEQERSSKNHKAQPQHQNDV
jgi:hypothetical protein